MQRGVSAPHLVALLGGWSTAGLCSSGGNGPQPSASPGDGGRGPTAGDHGSFYRLRQKRPRQPWAHTPVLESDDGGHGHVVFQPGVLDVV